MCYKCADECLAFFLGASVNSVYGNRLIGEIGSTYLFRMRRIYVGVRDAYSEW